MCSVSSNVQLPELPDASIVTRRLIRFPQWSGAAVSLWVLRRATTNPHRLKPGPLPGLPRTAGKLTE